jgi:hypothetical protein
VLIQCRVDRLRTYLFSHYWWSLSKGKIVVNIFYLWLKNNNINYFRQLNMIDNNKQLVFLISISQLVKGFVFFFLFFFLVARLPFVIDHNILYWCSRKRRRKQHQSPKRMRREKIHVCANVRHSRRTIDRKKKTEKRKVRAVRWCFGSFFFVYVCVK